MPQDKIAQIRGYLTKRVEALESESTKLEGGQYTQKQGVIAEQKERLELQIRDLSQGMGELNRRDADARRQFTTNRQTILDASSAYLRGEALVGLQENLEKAADKVAEALVRIQDPDLKSELFRGVARSALDPIEGFPVSEVKIIFDKLDPVDRKTFFAELKPESQKEVMGAEDLDPKMVADLLDAPDIVGSPKEKSVLKACVDLKAQDQMEVFKALKTQKAQEQLMDEFMSVSSGNLLSDDQKIELFRHVIKEQNNSGQQAETFKISDQTRELYVAALMQEIEEDGQLKTSLDNLYEAKTKANDVADSVVSSLKDKDVSGLFSDMSDKKEQDMNKEISQALEKATRKTVWQHIVVAVQKIAVSMGVISSSWVDKVKRADVNNQSEAVKRAAHSAVKKRFAERESDNRSAQQTQARADRGR